MDPEKTTNKSTFYPFYINPLPMLPRQCSFPLTTSAFFPSALSWCPRFALMKSLEFSGRFDALDGLRYFASLQVVLSHQSDARWQMRGTWADATMGFLDQRWAFSELFPHDFLHFPIFGICQVKGHECRTWHIPCRWSDFSWTWTFHHCFFWRWFSVKNPSAGF